MAAHTHAAWLNIVGDPKTSHANVAEVQAQTLVFATSTPTLLSASSRQRAQLLVVEHQIYEIQSADVGATMSRTKFGNAIAA